MGLRMSARSSLFVSGLLLYLWLSASFNQVRLKPREFYLPFPLCHQLPCRTLNWLRRQHHPSLFPLMSLRLPFRRSATALAPGTSFAYFSYCRSGSGSTQPRKCRSVLIQTCFSHHRIRRLIMPFALFRMSRLAITC